MSDRVTKARRLLRSPRVSLEDLRMLLAPIINYNAEHAHMIDRVDTFLAVYGIGRDAWQRRCDSGYYDRLCRHCRREFGVHTFDLAACPYPRTTLFEPLTCQAAIAGAGTPSKLAKCGAACVPGKERCQEHL